MEDDSDLNLETVKVINQTENLMIGVRPDGQIYYIDCDDLEKSNQKCSPFSRVKSAIDSKYGALIFRKSNDSFAYIQDFQSCQDINNADTITNLKLDGSIIFVELVELDLILIATTSLTLYLFDSSGELKSRAVCPEIQPFMTELTCIILSSDLRFVVMASFSSKDQNPSLSLFEIDLDSKISYLDHFVIPVQFSSEGYDSSIQTLNCVNVLENNLIFACCMNAEENHLQVLYVDQETKKLRLFKENIGKEEINLGRVYTSAIDLSPKGQSGSTNLRYMGSKGNILSVKLTYSS